MADKYNAEQIGVINTAIQAQVNQYVKENRYPNIINAACQDPMEFEEEHLWFYSCINNSGGNKTFTISLKKETGEFEIEQVGFRTTERLKIKEGLELVLNKLNKEFEEETEKK